MADVIRPDVQALEARLGEVEGYLHIDDRRKEIASLEEQSALPGFWDDAEQARVVMERLTRAREDVSALAAARAKLDDAKTALELGDEMDDEDLVIEAAQLCEELAQDLGVEVVFEQQVERVPCSSGCTRPIVHGAAGR